MQPNMMNGKLITVRSGASLMALLMACTACAGTPSRDQMDLAGPERIAEYEVDNVDQIVLNFPLGEATVAASDDNRLHVELEIFCETDKESCNKLADRVVLNSERKGGKLYVAPSVQSKTAYRNSEVVFRVKTPHGVPLRVSLGYGSLSIGEVRSPLEVTMSAGEVTVEMEKSAVRNVWLDANVGDAELRGSDLHEGNRKMLVGAEVDWREGPGEHDVSVDVATGAISVRLTD